VDRPNRLLGPIMNPNPHDETGLDGVADFPSPQRGDGRQRQGFIAVRTGA